ncbi:uncharacterized protein APUU_31628S [Aspergillus puulaauensis]|uniref:Uncharacterized protein n=1 Tax=Aspergillus puulaauensis TaxID=1220207 RepID=A0A7R7XM55_9EURO|nr:uncharacterized protein APUU_31628S [Aspergillus puulaauensis]BCS23403.1 hypothetical protein APUU_31628S [Aspergillus puulaauensis]
MPTTAAAAATSTCHQKLYEIPTHDAACAMPMNSTYHSLMTNCCGAASVTAYDECDYYCLAQGQTVGDLAECLIKGSAAGQVWCNAAANGTASASASATATATTTKTETETETGTGTGVNGAGVVSVKSVGVLALLAFAGVVV